MLGSPRRIFRGFTLAQLNELKASGFNRALYGTFTSVSGGSKNGSIENLDLETLLFEVNHEISILAGTGRPTKTYADFTGSRPSGTVNGY